MKAYVITKSLFFRPETYISVKKSEKEAEKAAMALHPHMIPALCVRNHTKAFFTDRKKDTYIFIREVEL